MQTMLKAPTLTVQFHYLLVIDKGLLNDFRKNTLHDLSSYTILADIKEHTEENYSSLRL